MNSLPTNYKALVIGASGAIGHAWLRQLQADPRCGAVHALSRHSSPAMHLEDESTMRACAEALRSMGCLHLVLDATGALSIDGQGPEKRMDQLDPLALQRALQVNAIGPALLIKHLSPLLAQGERVIWGKLSARVGSIEDNHKGGWYGYRASKAALNMLLQTSAIEIARKRPLAVLAALQPGTVRSALSRPFVGEAGTDPALAAAQLLAVLDQLPASARAQFVDHRGQSIPW